MTSAHVGLSGVADKAWLRAVRKRWTAPGSRPAGKVNAGQKVYAGWIPGAVLVMMYTGLLMWFSGILRTISRTSVIFVHDYLALSILIVLAGHITLAYRDPEARRGMTAGLVSGSWAKWEHPRWRYEYWPTAGIVTADLGNKGEPHMAGDDDISG